MSNAGGSNAAKKESSVRVYFLIITTGLFFPEGAATATTGFFLGTSSSSFMLSKSSGRSPMLENPLSGADLMAFSEKEEDDPMPKIISSVYLMIT